MATNNAFYDRMRPYAQRAASALGMPVDVILAQWALESGNGTSNLAKTQNNFGGIKYSTYSTTAQRVSGTDFAKYSSIDAFVTDYIRVLKLSYYKDVRNADSVTATALALGASPYDAGHYELDGVSGGKLLNLLGMTVANSNTTITDAQRAEIERKAAAGIPLTNPTPAAQAIYDAAKGTSPKVCPTCHRPL